MTLRAKTLAIGFVWVGIGASMVFVEAWWLRLLLFGVAVAVTGFLLRIKIRDR
jgi:uncharacterized membrane protein YbaN (DUF454 family)